MASYWLYKNGYFDVEIDGKELAEQFDLSMQEIRQFMEDQETIDDHLDNLDSQFVEDQETIASRRQMSDYLESVMSDSE